MHPLDPLRAANLLIEQFGSDAVTHAADRMQELAASGDAHGAACWAQIVQAVKVLERRERDGGDRVQ